MFFFFLIVFDLCGGDLFFVVDVFIFVCVCVCCCDLGCVCDCCFYVGCFCWIFCWLLSFKLSSMDDLNFFVGLWDVGVGVVIMLGCG